MKITPCFSREQNIKEQEQDNDIGDQGKQPVGVGSLENQPIEPIPERITNNYPDSCHPSPGFSSPNTPGKQQSGYKPDSATYGDIKRVCVVFFQRLPKEKCSDQAQATPYCKPKHTHCKNRYTNRANSFYIFHDNTQGSMLK